MTNLIIIVIVGAIVGAAIGYIVKAKKSGQKCIGCPDAATCGSGGCAGCHGNCSHCQSHMENK